MLWAVPLSGQTSFDGRFYEQAGVIFGDDSPVYSGMTILGLNLDSRPAESVRIRAGIELPFFHQRTTSQPGLQLQILNAAFTIGSSRLTIGRFLPLWGLCRIFRPMDLFRPQTFVQNSLSYPGVDGLFWRFYAGPSAFGVIVLAEPDLMKSRMAGLAEAKAGRFSALLAGLYDPAEPETSAGLTLQADLFVTLKTEILWRHSPNNPAGERDLFQTSVGADWSFAKYFFISAGYYFDETGVSKREDYLSLRLAEPGRMTLGRHYAEADIFVLTWDETKGGLSGIMNLTDRSFTIWPYASREFFHNVFLGVSWYFFSGKTGSEFASLPSRRHMANLYCYARF